MQYTFPIGVEPNTTKSDPERVSTPLNVGQLSKVMVQFPFGCAGLVGLRIRHYEHQLYPVNRDEWITGDNVLIEFECAYEILEGWTHFKVEAYSEDDFYTHTPVVNFVVLPLSGLYQTPIAWVEG